MRYRVQVTIGIGQLGPVIEAACKNNPEPDLKVDGIPDGQAALPPPKKAPANRRPPSSASERREVLENALKAGPKRWKDLRIALEHAGLPPGTLNSLISKWQAEGKIRRSAEGLWSLVDKHERAATA